MRDIRHDPSRIPTIEGKLKSDQLIPAEKLSNKAPRFWSKDGLWPPVKLKKKAGKSNIRVTKALGWSLSCLALIKYHLSKIIIQKLFRNINIISKILNADAKSIFLYLINMALLRNKTVREIKVITI